jgi:DNA mismatch repair protein MutH
LFACFQKSGHDNSGMRTAKFIGWQFWSFPMSFFEEARIVYQETQNRINRGTYKFSRKSESSVCHVRPHARNSKDLVEAPDGSQRKKYSFWLNANFIADELLGGGINESD